MISDFYFNGSVWEHEQARSAASSAQNVDLLNDLFGFGGATATPAHKVNSQAELKTNDLLADWTTNVKGETQSRIWIQTTISIFFW